MKQKKSRKSFAVNFKALKQWLELNEGLKSLGITKQDLETNSPFIVIHLLRDWLDRYGLTESQFCAMMADLEKEGFLKAGIFMYHPANEKCVIMKVNSEFIYNNEKYAEMLNRRLHGIR